MLFLNIVAIEVTVIQGFAHVSRALHLFDQFRRDSHALLRTICAKWREF